MSSCSTYFCPLEVLPLDLHRREPAAVGQRHRAVQVRSRETSWSAAPGSRARGRDVVVLDHLQHERRRPDLEERRDLAQVRVADDHVQAAVLLGVGVRLVAGIDDRALQRGLEPDLGLEEVRPLAELVPLPGPVVPRRLGPELAGPAEDLPGHEERREVRPPGSRTAPPVDEVVLVRAVRVPLAVAVVLVDREPLPPGSARSSSPSERSRTRSPALSWTTSSRGVAHSGVEYSGCAWST